jgi:hypothetical protein
MTVYELIEELQALDNKDVSVFVWAGGEIYPFTLDETISDRLDLNIKLRFLDNRESFD